MATALITMMLPNSKSDMADSTTGAHPTELVGNGDVSMRSTGETHWLRAAGHPDVLQDSTCDGQPGWHRSVGASNASPKEACP